MTQGRVRHSTRACRGGAGAWGGFSSARYSFRLCPPTCGRPPQMILTPAELLPAKTSFAYRVRHSWNPLPGPALSAMWFSGEDRELPRETVAEPIVVLPAQSARHQPSRNALCSHAAVVAAEHDLPVPFFANLIQQESGFKSHVVSPAGAQGIAQFMPRVARAYGLENPFDPLHSLSVSAKFLRELLGQFGNIGLAAAAYNAGPRRVQDWMAQARQASRRDAHLRAQHHRPSRRALGARQRQDRRDACCRRMRAARACRRSKSACRRPRRSRSPRTAPRGRGPSWRPSRARQKPPKPSSPKSRSQTHRRNCRSSPPPRLSVRSSQPPSRSRWRRRSPARRSP